MTTLKRRPSISGVNYRALVSALPTCGESTQLRDRNTTSAAKNFADITDLVKINEPTGQLDDDILVGELQRFVDSPDVDKARDLRLWRDTNGNLMGFGQLFISEQNDEIEGYLYFDIHPTRCSDTLGTEILQWSEERLREVGKEGTVPLKLRAKSRDDKSDRRLLLEKQGFTNERGFLTMACSLDQPLSSSPLPTGFTLKRLSWEQDFKAWVELFNESFIDHWNHHDLTVATAKHWLNHPHYRPELNLIAVAPDGTFAAFCVGYINQEENARNGYSEGWIKLLGTRRGFRKLGLGRAMLLGQMSQLKASGVERVKLGVDAQSLTSATRLYQSVGFYPVNTWLSYVKEIQP